MTEYAVMDYDGDPVIIEDGELYTVEPEEGETWNSETCKFEREDEDEDDGVICNGCGCCGFVDSDREWDEHWLYIDA